MNGKKNDNKAMPIGIYKVMLSKQIGVSITHLNYVLRGLKNLGEKPAVKAAKLLNTSRGTWMVKASVKDRQQAFDKWMEGFENGKSE